MGAGFHEGKTGNSLLELAAADDLPAFLRETEHTAPGGIDRAGLWYGRTLGPTTKMGFEERTPIMIAALYGSTNVLSHILSTRSVDVNRAVGSDGATPLHCAAAGGSPASFEAVSLLISASADVDAVDVSGRKAGDLIPIGLSKKKKAPLERLLNVKEDEEGGSKTPRSKREYHPVVLDINSGLYGSDEFRMYSFKVKPCSRAYSHDWTECPFVHPGENARRRDPRKHHYTCVPCPEFKKAGSCCPRGEGCEYAHGVFESWLHPAQYRTRLCKDEVGCSRKVCFFAHRPEDLRPLYASTGSGLPDPKSPSSPMGGGGGGMWQSNLTTPPPPTLQLSGSGLKTAFRSQLIDEMINNLSSPYGSLEDVFGQQVRSSYPSKASYGYDMNTRLSSSAFAKRSQSFNYRAHGVSTAGFTQWGSPDGKLEWGFSGGDDDVSKFRKSASFRQEDVVGEPDVSWVNTLVRDGRETGTHWFDQVCIEQEQSVA